MNPPQRNATQEQHQQCQKASRLRGGGAGRVRVCLYPLEFPHLPYPRPFLCHEESRGDGVMSCSSEYPRISGKSQTDDSSLHVGLLPRPDRVLPVL